MENEKIFVEENVENVFLVKSMRRIKHGLVLIAFGFPIVNLVLNLLVWVMFSIIKESISFLLIFNLFLFSHQRGVIFSQIQFQLTSFGVQSYQLQYLF